MGLHYPILSGMAYVSARFSFGLSPRVAEDWYWEYGGFTIEKIRPGIWQYSRTPTDLPTRIWRIYALDLQGQFADDRFDFDEGGYLQPQGEFEGWVRVARVNDGDADVLDSHAQAIPVGFDMSMEYGGILKYEFRKAFTSASFFV